MALTPFGYGQTYVPQYAQQSGSGMLQPPGQQVNMNSMYQRSMDQSSPGQSSPGSTPFPTQMPQDQPTYANVKPQSFQDLTNNQAYAPIPGLLGSFNGYNLPNSAWQSRPEGIGGSQFMERTPYGYNFGGNQFNPSTPFSNVQQKFSNYFNDLGAFNSVYGSNEASQWANGGQFQNGLAAGQLQYDNIYNKYKALGTFGQV